MAIKIKLWASRSSMGFKFKVRASRAWQWGQEQDSGERNRNKMKRIGLFQSSYLCLYSNYDTLWQFGRYYRSVYFPGFVFDYILHAPYCKCILQCWNFRAIYGG
jgi:hypothetical protein